MDEVLRLTTKDLQYILDNLERQDIAMNLGQCEDHMDEQGYCKMCTALQRLDTFVSESLDRKAGLWYSVNSNPEDDDW